MNARSLLPVTFVIAALLATDVCRAQQTVDFDAQVQPILRKYCAGCHNADEANAELRLDSFAAIQRGSENGQVLARGDAAASRLVQVLRADAEPRMPPEDSPQLDQQQIDVLMAWINAGARGPKNDVPSLVVPEVDAAQGSSPITALAVSPTRAHQALARFKSVQIMDTQSGESVEWKGHAGKVNDLAYSPDGRWLAAASGIAGLRGEIQLRDTQSGKTVLTLRGHDDTAFTIDFDHDGKHLVSGSYDKSIIVWDLQTGRALQTMNGHNDAVYDVKFSPDGSLVASASGDETVKVWDVQSGQRFDTLGQPLAEQYAVAFSPDGRFLAAGGVDNRIRVWRLVTREKPGINPLKYARFGHERAIVQLCFTPDGSRLVSAAEDGIVKVWATDEFVEIAAFPKLEDIPTALVADDQQIVVGCTHGNVHRWKTPSTAAASATTQKQQASPRTIRLEGKPIAVSESEPNDTLERANPVQLPAVVSGVVHRQSTETDAPSSADVDLFRFEATAGIPWVIETLAARNQSLLDSRIEILDASGQVVPRMHLQAMRDSYITFRGINSSTADIRLHNWEEMDLNQYLYINGEVTRLLLYPRGPDSGFQLYKKGGRRRTYFDTSAMIHALHEPCYIVRPIPQGESPIPNGLPQFTIPYENDDDSEGRLKGDSRLSFVAPNTGRYIARVSDVRNEQGEKYTYELVIRPPRPDFNVRLSMSQAVVNAGSGKEFIVEADRIDGYNGPIIVTVTGMPPGWSITSPIEIQAGHYVARGTVNAMPSAQFLDDKLRKQIRATARATIRGAKIMKRVPAFSNLQVTTEPKILVSLKPTAKQPAEFLRRDWRGARVLEAESMESTTLTVLDDQRVLASGDTPDRDQYRIDINTQSKHVSAVKLTMPGHPSLPTGAAGRESDVGNFALTGLEIQQIVNGESRPLAIRSVKADYSQPGWSVANILDANPKTGWAVAEQKKDKSWAVKRNGKDATHWCEVELAEPVSSTQDIQLRLIIHQQSDVKQATIGCFSIGTSASQPEIPAVAKIVIRPGETVTASLRVDRKNFDARIQFESLNLNLPHGVIVDNIGLNGVLIPEKQTDRTVFFTAAPWVPETSRLIYFKANQDGTQTSWPVLLQIVAE